MFVWVFQIFLLHTPSHLESKCTSQYYDCAHATTRGYLWHGQRWVRIQSERHSRNSVRSSGRYTTPCMHHTEDVLRKVRHKHRHCEMRYENETVEHIERNGSEKASQKLQFTNNPCNATNTVWWLASHQWHHQSTVMVRLPTFLSSFALLWMTRLSHMA